MLDQAPLQHRGYTEVNTPSFQRIQTESNRRWTLCRRIGIISATIVCVTFVVLVSIGSSGPRPELGDVLVNDTPLLSLSFPIKEKRYSGKGRLNYTITNNVLVSCMDEAREVFKRRKHLESDIFEQRRNRSDQTPFSYHQQVTTLNPEMRRISDSAVLAEESIRALMDLEHATIDELKSAEVSGLLNVWDHCKQNIIKDCPAPDYKYRSLDGSCNNLMSGDGVYMQPFRRILPPVYDDNFASPRTKSVVANQLLPSARAVSSRFPDSTMVIENKLSMLFLTWGQFIDHDLTNTGATKGVNGSAITCCDSCSECRVHPECFAIKVEKDDSFYAEKGVKCLDFVRSAPAAQCQIDGREQFNQATAWMDGSMIYGSTRLEGDIRIRAHERGTLRARLNPDGRWLLPISLDPKDGCNREEFIKQSRYCFKAGDFRVNEQIGITALHTIWLREHNRIANTLADLNRHWSEDKLYEESRRIVIAQLQHITYNEFIPLLLGEKLTEYLKLRPLQSGYDSSYNAGINSGISNEFATAAFRFGHSMLQGLVEIYGTQGRNIDYIQLKNILFNPFALWDFGKIDAVIRGSAQQSPRKLDTTFSNQVTNHLFQPEKSNFGFDLFALNVQRGRDHGLAPYYRWREVCNLSPINSWADLENATRSSSFRVLKDIYLDPKDVDLFVGILAEKYLSDGILGPVGSCIIADQFVRLKIGDRFWYETSDTSLRFTTDQLSEIRKTSLAQVLCVNGDAMDAIQARAMETVSETNARRRCAEFPKIDLTSWEDDSWEPISSLNV